MVFLTFHLDSGDTIGINVRRFQVSKRSSLLVFLFVFFVALSVTDLSGIIPPTRLEVDQKSGAIWNVLKLESA